jgi:hypothetical protein
MSVVNLQATPQYGHIHLDLFRESFDTINGFSMIVYMKSAGSASFESLRDNLDILSGSVFCDFMQESSSWTKSDSEEKELKKSDDFRNFIKEQSNEEVKVCIPLFNVSPTSLRAALDSPKLRVVLH